MTSIDKHILIATVLQFEGIWEFLDWLKHEKFIVLDYNDGLPSLNVYSFVGGKPKLDRSLAHIERTSDGTYRIIVAGSLVAKEDRTEPMAFTSDEDDELECSTRVFFNMRGNRTSTGKLIMPRLPPEGLYTEELKREYEPE